ncbi:MAG: hypothetical protein JW712_09875 [Dehalococcoidales bacterium]|nr:hypothetical protein [Dehalococcoidales bacterium]
MSEAAHEKLIVTEMKGPESVMAALPEYEKRVGKRILWVDGNVIEGSFQMNCSWHMYSSDRGPEQHAHDVDEILGFFSNDPDNPYDLDGEIELWIGDEKMTLDHSAMVFLPAGVKHCPLILRKVGRPIIHFSVVTGNEYITKKEGWKTLTPEEARSCVVTELKIPPEKQAIVEDYNKYARRILWMDENASPGAFHINTSWFRKAAETLENVPHLHSKDDEIIGFLGSDHEHPEELNAEVEIWLGDEKYVITKSAMIFVPAGLKHCPLILRRVDRPIFHFTTVPGKRYVKEELI